MSERRVSTTSISKSTVLVRDLMLVGDTVVNRRKEYLAYDHSSKLCRQSGKEVKSRAIMLSQKSNLTRHQGDVLLQLLDRSEERAEELGRDLNCRLSMHAVRLGSLDIVHRDE